MTRQLNDIPVLPGDPPRPPRHWQFPSPHFRAMSTCHLTHSLFGADRQVFDYALTGQIPSRVCIRRLKRDAISIVALHPSRETRDSGCDTTFSRIHLPSKLMAHKKGRAGADPPTTPSRHSGAQLLSAHFARFAVLSAGCR